MESKGAKEIKKYKGFLPEGYGFVYIVNNEESATFKEKCNYTTFTGLTLLSPQQGASYDIEVAPKSTKMVLLRCSPDGYSLGLSTMTSVLMGGKALK